jgi:hypothetical protein
MNNSGFAAGGRREPVSPLDGWKGICRRHADSDSKPKIN